MNLTYWPCTATGIRSCNIMPEIWLLIYNLYLWNIFCVCNPLTIFQFWSTFRSFNKYSPEGKALSDQMSSNTGQPFSDLIWISCLLFILAPISRYLFTQVFNYHLLMPQLFCLVAELVKHFSPMIDTTQSSYAYFLSFELVHAWLLNLLNIYLLS